MDINSILNSSNDSVQGYADELAQLARLASNPNVDPQQMDRIRQRIKAIKEDVGRDNHGRIDDLYSGYVGVAIEASAGGDFNSEQKKLLANAVKANVFLGAIKTGTGAVQALRAFNKKKGLNAPKLPPSLERNPLLDSQIASAQVAANNGDAELRSFFRDELAELKKVNNARAANTGTAGQFAANSQANSLSERRALREFAGDEARRRQLARQELNGLISQRSNEDARINRDLMSRFNVQEQRFRSAVNQQQNQINSGLTNAFQGIQEVGQNLPFLLATQQQGRSRVGSGLPTLSNNIPVPNSIAPTPSQVPQPSIGEMLSLGNRANRTPDQVAKFQQFAIDKGILDHDADLGVFDERTAAAYDAIYFGEFNNLPSIKDPTTTFAFPLNQ